LTHPWEQAHAAAAAAGVSLRPLRSIEDADRILAVMIATWGEHQLLPREMIRALAESGNDPYGAFDGDEMVGYVLGWAGVDDTGPHVHSHMLAALPSRRHRGLGTALKLAQRAQSLDHGFTVVRWTFDPMIARNAYLNMVKLGAVADRFHRNFYGEMSDTLNRGERSDRLVVRWDLEREPGPRDVPADAAIVVVPAEYAEMRDADRDRALAERDRVAAELERLFAEGAVAAGFDRERSAYLLVEAENA
jgi:predicted GNAT superfamily acetyltransferase